MQARHFILGLCLVVTVAASIHANKEGSTGEIVELAKPHAPQGSVSIKSQSNDEPFVAVRHWDVDADSVDLFSAQPVPKDPQLEKLAAIQSQPPVIEPTIPVAPPLPFTYLGKMLNNGKIIVYVAKGDRNYALSGGETIDGIYTIVAVNPQQVIFNYKPLATQQILLIGAAN